MWISVLLRDKSARHWRELNPQPFDPESSVQSNILQQQFEEFLSQNGLSTIYDILK